MAYVIVKSEKSTVEEKLRVCQKNNWIPTVVDTGGRTGEGESEKRIMKQGDGNNSVGYRITMCKDDESAQSKKKTEPKKIGRGRWRRGREKEVIKTRASKPRPRA